MLNAKTIAKYFIYLLDDAINDLTNMKLNKLLYFAQGHYLGEKNRRLFNDDIQAWEHGPVVKEIYQEYKKYEDRSINVKKVKIDTNFSILSDMDKRFLLAIARQYGSFTASQLRNSTHKAGSPWSQVYKKGVQNIIIPTSVMKEYFKDAERIEPLQLEYDEDDFIGYRDKDGYLVLPADWDDEQIQ